MIDPVALRGAYREFLAPGRVLLTGHSHQAWPDVAKPAMNAAFDDAAAHCDDKWSRAMEAADAVRAAVARRIGVGRDEIALAPSTHELVARFLSALDLRKRPRLVSTTGEFHTIDRQLRRLRDEGIEIELVPVAPVVTLSERIAAAIDARTAGVLVSSVLFETSTIVPGLAAVAEKAAKHGAEVLFDAYHAFNVVPFSIAELGANAFVTAGGYKYAQWGEGCCFLRVPATTTLSPVYSGWFADWASLGEPRDSSKAVGYGPRPCDRFAGSTYDPVSHYRARAVDAFFGERGMTVEALRAINLRQTRRILDGLDGCEIATPREDAERGGFVSVRTERASDVVKKLRERDVLVDSRGDLVRFGPAPYLTDDEIDEGLAEFRDARGGARRVTRRFPRLVLASTSSSRRELLERAGIAFHATSHLVDERVFDAVAIEDRALRLAIAKAADVASRFPGSLVLGSDQVISVDGDVVHKPGGRELAEQQLRRLSGRVHELRTAVALRHPDGRVESAVSVHRMTMRALSDAEIAAYVARDTPYDCAGSYRIERGGIGLFERIEGEDFTGIVGMPMIATCALLRAAGIAV